MQWFLKSALAVLLFQAVNAFSAQAACWQLSTTKAPPDGRFCFAFNDGTLPDSPDRVFYGRSALDLTSVSNGRKTHFCAFEAIGGVHRKKSYFWLQGTEYEVRAVLWKTISLVNNLIMDDQPDNSTSESQLDQWLPGLTGFIKLFQSFGDKGQSTEGQSTEGQPTEGQPHTCLFKLDYFISLFQHCSDDDKPTEQHQKEIDAAKTGFCIRSKNGNILDFGKISRSGECKIFDATLSDEKPSLTLSELAEQARLLKSQAHFWVRSGWAERFNEPIASHSPYGFAYGTEYCILQAFIRGHKYCSIDQKGRYQTGNSINYGDQYKGQNNAYMLIYMDLPPNCNDEYSSRSADEGFVDESTPARQDL